MKLNMPVLILMGASVMWGLSWLPLKHINSLGVEGLVLAFLSYGILSLALLPLLVRHTNVLFRHKKAMLFIALFGGGANLAFTYALIYGEVIRVMVLFYLLPLWGVLGGRIFLKESIDGWRYLGVALALVGAFVILGGFKAFETPPSWIDLIALLSGLFFAMNNLVFRAAQEVPVGSKITLMFGGSLLLSGTLLLMGVEAIPQSISGAAWSGIVLYAVFWLLIANIGSQWGVTHMEAGRSSIIIILELITAVVSATLIAGEIMQMNEYIGGALILAAALIEALRTKDDEVPQTTI